MHEREKGEGKGRREREREEGGERKREIWCIRVFINTFVDCLLVKVCVFSIQQLSQKCPLFGQSSSIAFDRYYVCY